MGDNDLIQEWVALEEATYRTIKVKIYKALYGKLK
jgi:hypothetical protein